MTGVKQQSRIPEFGSRDEADEAAAWFDTHDLAGYQDEFAPVEVRFRQDLSEGRHIRLDPDSLTNLRGTADRRGVGPTTLARMWTLERLHAQPGER
jgi:hypothetical protein